MATQQTPEVLAVLKRCGIQQKDLAGKFGCSQALISMWAHGVKPIPAYRLRDLWALAYLAREAVGAGGAGREALLAWTPTRLVWQTEGGQEAFTRTWNVPWSPNHLMDQLDPPTFQRLLEQPGGGDTVHLHDATIDLSSYVGRVFSAVLAGTPPAAGDLETLRHMTDMAAAAVAELQMLWARQPLPPTRHPEEETHADQIDQRRALQRADRQ